MNKQFDELIEKLMDWESVQIWAQSQQIVGDSDSSYQCPLANYLNAMTDETWTVSDGQIARIADEYNGAEKETYPLPEWAKIAADLVDAMQAERITGEEFSEILLEVQPE